MKLLNSEKAKFTRELFIHNTNWFFNKKLKYLLRKAGTSELFFKCIDNQLSNQLLYNAEEKEAYFLNEDRQLFKLKFEPVNQ